MNTNEFQNRMLDKYAERLPDAKEFCLDYGDEPVPENVFRAYNIAILGALADMLTELGILEQV